MAAPMSTSTPMPMSMPIGAPPGAAYPVAPVTHVKVVSGRGWYNAKIVLGSLSLTTAVIILALGGALANNFPSSDYAWYDLILGYCPAILAFGWQTAEFITLCVRRNRGIHPGAHVGLHLVIWLASAVAAGFITAITISNSSCGSYCRRTFGFSSSSFESLYNQYMGMEAALTAFVYILL